MTDAEREQSDTARAQGPRVPSPAAAGDTGDEAAERRRRLAAWSKATRTLSHAPGLDRIGERLARLAEESTGVHDAADWTDFYGNEDSVVGELERRTAAELGMEAAAFFPTGTMAQQVALRCWAGRTGNDTVAMHPRAHPVMWERDALRVLTGVRVVHPSGAARLPTADEVRGLAEPFGTLMLELPLREAGFVLPSWEELSEAVEAARDRDAVVHFDGARLWECAPHFGRTLPEIAALADTVYVSYYKTLGGLSGAALAGPAALIEEAVAWRHRYGGQVFRQWPAALSALAGLERELPRVPAYVAHAKVVAAALREAFAEAGRRPPWWQVWPEVPHTHQFQVWLPYGARELTEAGIRQVERSGTLLFRQWSEPAEAPPGLSMHEVTVAAPGLSWSAADVREAAADFLGCLEG
jgi:threonine aldolase